MLRSSQRQVGLFVTIFFGRKSQKRIFTSIPNAAIVFTKKRYQIKIKKGATAMKQLHLTKNQSINLTKFYNLKP